MKKSDSKWDKIGNIVTGAGWFLVFVASVLLWLSMQGRSGIAPVIIGMITMPLMWISLIPVIFRLGNLEKKLKKKMASIERYNKLPHFGKMLDKSQVMKIIRNADFVPYETESGRTLSNIMVSNNDKWVCILDGYMPIDLICGYNAEKKEIYSIDGGIIKLPPKAELPEVSDDLKCFFEDRGVYYKNLPEDASEMFKSFIDLKKQKLDKADFSRLRYQWEKASNTGSNQNGGKYTPIMKNGKACDTIFERVLSDNDIKKTAKAVRERKISISEYLNFDDYKNEFCVCNAVAVMEQIHYPANKDGLDFLFKCIRDIDEAFFGPAVDVLMEFPHDVLKEKLEIEARRAYEAQDVLGLGGLIYLARQINYQINYIQEIKRGNIENGSSEGIDKSADEFLVFDVVEKAVFGSNDVQEFPSGGVAYQEQK